MKKTLLISILLAIYLSSFGQIRVVGRVTTKEDDKTTPIPFASVILKNELDTIKVEYSAITDMKGNYSFDNVQTKCYILEISFLGYSSLSENIEVFYPETGNILEFNYTLKIDPKLLNEITITGSSINKGIDKTIYRITSQDFKSARFSMDLLEVVPSLSIDPISQKIVSSRGSVKILIDGVSSGEIDLKAIPPNKVDRIEFYDIPPARYIGYNTVVNVITKNLDDGFAAGVTLQNAFTTGFANDDIYIKIVSGRSQFSTDYTINYRNYSDVNTTTKYAYLFNDKQVIRYENINSPFKYTDHFINQKYVNQLQDNYVFQAKISSNLSFRNSKDLAEVEYQMNGIGMYRTGEKTNNSDTFNPFLNLYFWKQLRNRQSITADVIGNLFEANQTVINQEYSKTDDHLELNDRMELNNKKKSFIGEFVYEKTLHRDKFTIGNKVEKYTMTSIVENSFDNIEYVSSFFSNYFYADYTGHLGNFIYKATVGSTYRQSDNYINRYNAFLFNPFLMLGYSINQKNKIRILIGQKSVEPSLSEQSDNMVFITDNILRKGNPYLKNSLERISILNYGMVYRFFELDMYFVVSMDKNKVGSYFIKSDDNYLLTSLNNYKDEMYGFAYTGSIKPFGNNLLTVKFHGEVGKYYVSNYVINSHTHWSTSLNYEILLKTEKFMASFQGKVVDKDLTGTYLRQNENNALHLTVRYTHKNISIWSNWMFMFAPSQYITETIPSSLITYSSNRKIYDNKNMFALGLSWTFNRGNKYEEQSKLINNRDVDSGLFK